MRCALRAQAYRLGNGNKRVCSRCTRLIGQLCSLMARGAIISMVIVMVFLPSALVLFDRVIVKSTYGMKKELKMRKDGTLEGGARNE